MKSLKIIIAVLFSSTIALTSCEDENITPVKSETVSAQKKQTVHHKDGGGEEEEWIIIYGVVQSESTSGNLEGAEVILFDEDFNVGLDTVLSNSSGEFEFQNDSNYYTFKISKEGYQTFISNPIEFPSSNPVTLQLQDE